MIVEGPIKPVNSITDNEIRAALDAMEREPLSGYLAGRERGGYHVRALEDAWCETFKVKHAIAANSATSGLLAAAFAVERKTRFAVPAMTMSATAAAPMFTGAKPFFCDVEDETFGLTGGLPHDASIFVTNLFGHPARLHDLRRHCDEHGTVLIEDNAQSPFAMEYGKYSGTIGHIGVNSFNVHKPLQCGEGGMITTDYAAFAGHIRKFINHGENNIGNISLNLRMPEVCAAIALTQLRRGREIVGGRIEQAEAIIAAIGDIPGLRPPIIRDGCLHVYYTIPFLVEKNRTEFCAALREEGVPIVEGYVPPLYRMPAFQQFARPCPVAEDLHDRRLLYIENCAWDFTPEQIRQVGEAFKRAAEQWLT